MMLNGMKSFTTNLEKYQEENIEYNMKAALLEIRKNFPGDHIQDVKSIDLNNDKYKALISKNAFNPNIDGSLAKSLGIHNQILTLDLWQDLFNGYCPAHFLPPDSHLLKNVIDTLKGPMVRLNNNPTPIVIKNGLAVYDKAKASKERRATTELMFTCDKNLSIAISRMSIDDSTVEKRLDELKQMVMKQYIIPELTRDALISAGTNGRELKLGMELLVVDFMHPENRGSTKTDVEPHYHWHTNILNTVSDTDGKLYKLNTDQIFKNMDKYNALFQAYFKDALEKEWGFRFQKVFLKDDALNDYLSDDDKTITAWELHDDFVPANVRDYFSQRSKDIARSVKESGKNSSAVSNEIARLETRKNKADLSPSEIKSIWKQEFRNLQYDVHHILNASQLTLQTHTKRLTNTKLSDNYLRKTQYQKNLLDIGAFMKSGQVLKSPTEDREKLIHDFYRKHKESAFTENQFKSHLVKQLLGHHKADEAIRVATEIFEQEAVMLIDKSQEDFFKGYLNNEPMSADELFQKEIRFARDVKYTTKTMIEMDNYISESFQVRVDDTNFIFDRKDVGRAILDYEITMSAQIKGNFKLAHGQREAVIQCLTAPGALINIAGRAGAGKSTLLSVVSKEYLKNGYEVIGTSIANTATKNLAESTGLENYKNSTILINELDSGKLKLTNKTVLIFDEAGMADTATFYKLAKHVNKAGAKLILSGEKEQLQAVGAGGNFKVLNDNFNTVQVSEINRQRVSAVTEQWKRDNVELLATGQANVAFKELYDRGFVAIERDNKAIVKKLVKDYLVDSNSYQDKIVMASTNADIDKINNAIRDGLKAKHLISHDSTDNLIVLCKDEEEREFTRNDRLIFVRNTKSSNGKKIDNSTQGTVQFIKMDKKGKPSMKVLLDDGEQIWIDCSKQPPIKHAYCITVHKSQGLSKENSYLYVSANPHSLHDTYVAGSRHKGEFRVYLSDELTDKLSQQVYDTPPTPGQVKAIQAISKSKKIEVAPGDLESFGRARTWLNTHYMKFDEYQGHRLDDFSTYLNACSQTNFKKTTHDYKVLPQGYDLVASINKKLKRELENSKNRSLVA